MVKLTRAQHRATSHKPPNGGYCCPRKNDRCRDREALDRSCTTLGDKRWWRVEASLSLALYTSQGDCVCVCVGVDQRDWHTHTPGQKPNGISETREIDVDFGERLNCVHSRGVSLSFGYSGNSGIRAV